MSTVYVVQEMPGRDILSADKYGKLVPVMPPGYQVVLSPGPAVSKIKKVINYPLFRTAVCVAIGITLLIENHLMYSGMAMGVGLREFFLAFKDVE